MKLSAAAVILISMVAGSSAFTFPAHQTKSFVALRMVDDETPDNLLEDRTVVDEEVTSSFNTPKATSPRQMSQALPFMVRPAVLDGTMVGDVGFDPFGFAKSKEDLLNYREAEIKHARLAMLVRRIMDVSYEH